VSAAFRRIRRGHGLRIEDCDLVVRPQILDDTLRDERKRSDDAERQQDPQRAADQIDPEIAEGILLFLEIPGMNAIASAMPVAAELKLWYASRPSA
jgi:hypothetical protein